MSRFLLTLAALCSQQPVLAAEAQAQSPPHATESSPGQPSPPVTESREDWPLFPIGARKAAERGYRVQRALGASAMIIRNIENMESGNLAVVFAKGADPAEDTDLTEVPFVTTDKMRSRTVNSEFKADLWVFPFLNIFAGVGKAKGDIDIGIDIDVDAMFPPPFCRPANPCGTMHLPFKATVDNMTVTLGAILAYGSDDWFAAAIAARTITASAKDRSDIRTTDLSVRGGPRFHLDSKRQVILSPYVGANYFKLDATVGGTVQSGPVFPDGDAIHLRYRVDLSTRDPWAGISGLSLELNPKLALQAEYQWGSQADRMIFMLTIRP